MSANTVEPISKEEVTAYKASVMKAKRDAEVITLREWYDSTPEHSKEIAEYMQHFKQLGRLGRELHDRGVKRVTERFGDSIRTHIEATYRRDTLDLLAPLCAMACTLKRSDNMK